MLFKQSPLTYTVQLLDGIPILGIRIAVSVQSVYQKETYVVLQRHCEWCSLPALEQKMRVLPWYLFLLTFFSYCLRWIRLGQGTYMSEHIPILGPTTGFLLCPPEAKSLENHVCILVPDVPIPEEGSDLKN